MALKKKKKKERKDSMMGQWLTMQFLKSAFLLSVGIKLLVPSHTSKLYFFCCSSLHFILHMDREEHWRGGDICGKPSLSSLLPWRKQVKVNCFLYTWDFFMCMWEPVNSVSLFYKFLLNYGTRVVALHF